MSPHRGLFCLETTMYRKVRYALLITTLLSVIMCGENMDLSEAKNNLTQTDKDFAEYARKNGIGKAFEYFAADSAVIFQDYSNPIKGRENIASLFSLSEGSSLDWEPYFTEISASGDLGYTLGNYTATHTDDSGHLQITKGFYMTIWKKQADGQWRYVFDSGVKGPKDNN
jgi:ketosteroid isomerase-like protein